MTTLLVIAPQPWAGLWVTPLAKLAPELNVLVHPGDVFEPAEIEYALTFRPPPGFLRSLPNLKAVFSAGAGVDAILSDAEYPHAVPLVRFVHHTLARDMMHYIVMHTLIFHRRQRAYDEFQRERAWRQSMPQRLTEDTRVGILGLGEIGTLAAEHLRDLDFAVAGWSRSKKHVPGVESFAGSAALPAFLARSDILACVLPLTAETRGILNRETFAMLPQGAFVINVARGGHVVEADLVAAIDSGHLSGAALDVFASEPLPPTSPLWTHPKITVTPHVAALTDPTASALNALQGIRKREAGEPLENVVDMERGY